MNPQENIRYTLQKEERLYAQKRIDALFESGKSFVAYPLRVVYVLRDTDNPEIPASVSILVSVSKKKFKRAVKRNRVKRLVREAYRLNKNVFLQLTDSSCKSIDIAFLYLKSELPDFPEIEKAVLKTAVLLSQKIKNDPEKENEPCS